MCWGLYRFSRVGLRGRTMAGENGGRNVAGKKGREIDGGRKTREKDGEDDDVML